MQRFSLNGSNQSENERTHTHRLFMKNGSVPLECLMNKILWSSLLLIRAVYSKNYCARINREIEWRQREGGRRDKEQIRGCGSDARREREQITMKKARIWHFVVYKLIYGTIRVFALQFFQQQHQQQKRQHLEQNDNDNDIQL